jgi:Xaa-Pro aminopeptidase
MTASPEVFAQRIASAQSTLTELGLAACLVPSSDPHLSEYLPARWQGREWLSGFTGSMGTLVVTQNRAALFADSRYWTQAETELAHTGIELVKIDTGASTHHVQWLAQNTGAGKVVGVDGAVLGLAAAQQLRDVLAKVGATVRTDVDLFAHIWPDRASLPLAPVYEHDAAFASAPRGAKLAQVRAAMALAGASHHFISTVDDIAWLFNLRGSDVSYNPVFLAHALITASSATLFIAAGKVPATLAARLKEDGVAVQDYALAGPAPRDLGPA